MKQLEAPDVTAQARRSHTEPATSGGGPRWGDGGLRCPTAQDTPPCLARGVGQEVVGTAGRRRYRESAARPSRVWWAVRSGV